MLLLSDLVITKGDHYTNVRNINKFWLHKAMEKIAEEIKSIKEFGKNQRRPDDGWWFMPGDIRLINANYM